MKAFATIKGCQLPQGKAYFITGKRTYSDGSSDTIRVRKDSKIEAVAYCEENGISYIL